MIDGTGNANADARQMLEDLVSSPGWRLFCDEARRIHGAEAMAMDLLTAGMQTTDLRELGAMTAARLSVLKAVDQLLDWPTAVLDQYRTVHKEDE